MACVELYGGVWICIGLWQCGQDCIPVGCVPPARWPYLPACSAVGGCMVPGGCMAPVGGALSRRWVVSQHALKQTPPLWTEWQTGVKILPCPRLRLRAIMNQYTGVSFPMNKTMQNITSYKEVLVMTELCIMVSSLRDRCQHRFSLDLYIFYRSQSLSPYRSLSV